MYSTLFLRVLCAPQVCLTFFVFNIGCSYCMTASASTHLKDPLCCISNTTHTLFPSSIVTTKSTITYYYILHNSLPPTQSEGGVLGKWHQAESFAFAPFVTPVLFDGNDNDKWQVSRYVHTEGLRLRLRPGRWTRVHMRASTVENNSRDRRIAGSSRSDLDSDCYA